ncbi:MAG TPA: biotin transporter BioY [Elusimicrobiota bacterium]|jgi:biotin transport system substrate-specific component|nr:biotin transporter BioY [Elusimicrobiota bacterium]
MKTAAAAPASVLADALLPPGALADGLAVVVASLFVAVCAQAEIHLPFTPVPISGATLGVLYAGALLGSRRGAAAVALYLLEGAAGMPVFSGGAAGFLHFAGPTGGYLLGYPLGAYAVGLLAERGWDRTPARAFATMVLGSLPILGVGLLGLARFLPARGLLAAGLWPFVPGDLIKAAVSAGLLPLGWRIVGRRASRP